MGGFKNHEVNGPGEVQRSWGIGTILEILTGAREKRAAALAEGNIPAARQYHWIAISALIALGVCTVAAVG